jgi:heme-degrading monooxygenase HmoA
MYIAMNHFMIVLGKEVEFETIWKERDTHFIEVPGFIEFHLIKGREEETHTLYASHSTWQSYDEFVSWTKSDAFRIAHEGAGVHGNIYKGHPVFEGFEVII